MFIFNHKSKILDVSSYDCLAIVNPENSSKNIYISKIKVNVSYISNITLLGISGNFDGYKEKDITGDVKSNIIGERSGKTVAKFYGHPYTKNGEILKELVVETFDNLVDDGDNYILEPGNSLVIRATPVKTNSTVNISINYYEK